MNELLQFIHTHYVAVGSAAAAAYISLVNALPERRQDWDTYSVFYHFLRGLTPISRQSSPIPKGGNQ